MKPQAHRRIIWVVCSLLATAVLAGVSALAVRLRPYWVAKYRGHGADLRNAMLVYAPLAGADLIHADLHGANLHKATFRGADLIGADLTDTDLMGTDLTNAVFRMDLVVMGNTPPQGCPADV
jgi:uncharacterized protein YjbI with pentapeptide repeats